MDMVGEVVSRCARRAAGCGGSNPCYCGQSRVCIAALDAGVETHSNRGRVEFRGTSGRHTLFKSGALQIAARTGVTMSRHASSTRFFGTWTDKANCAATRVQFGVMLMIG